KILTIYETMLAARAWARNPEDQPVAPGEFSALHWAKKSESHVEHAEEWAQSPDPISTEAGGDGASDRSAKWWANHSEQQAERAEDARDLAAGYVNDIVSEKEVPIFATQDGMAALSLPAGMDRIRVLGKSSIFDLGAAADFVRVDSEPI